MLRQKILFDQKECEKMTKVIKRIARMIDVDSSGYVIHPLNDCDDVSLTVTFTQRVYEHDGVDPTIYLTHPEDACDSEDDCSYVAEALGSEGGCTKGADDSEHEYLDLAVQVTTSRWVQYSLTARANSPFAAASKILRYVCAEQVKVQFPEETAPALGELCH